MTHIQDVARHYQHVWGSAGQVCPSPGGPAHELPPGFQVLCFAPHGERTMWTYATCGMSRPEDEKLVELHLFAPRESGRIVEILYAVAHYHRTGARLDLEHTVNFGVPWTDASACTHGLISLPYLDGPDLEILELRDATINFYWLIPVTPAEVEYKKQHGMEALETRFEERQFNYLDPDRPSVV